MFERMGAIEDGLEYLERTIQNRWSTHGATFSRDEMTEMLRRIERLKSDVDGLIGEVVERRNRAMGDYDGR